VTLTLLHLTESHSPIPIPSIITCPVPIKRKGKQCCKVPGPFTPTEPVSSPPSPLKCPRRFVAARWMGDAVVVHATACILGRMTDSAKRTARARWCVGDVSVGCLSLRRIVLGSGDLDLREVGDRPADEEVDEVLFSCRLSVGRSDCQSMPCCTFRRAKDSRRASMSSLDLTILSGWW